MMTVKIGSALKKVIRRHQAVAETDDAPGSPDGLQQKVKPTPGHRSELTRERGGAARR